MTFEVRSGAVLVGAAPPIPPPCPNVGGDLRDPGFILWHYTAGPSLQGTLSTFADPKRKASAHIVIGRDGQVAQVVPLNRAAWHAGVSWWEGPRGIDGKIVVHENFNHLSIGIELVSAGLLTKRVDGSWATWWGAAVPAEEIFVDDHDKGWQIFMEPQIESALEVAKALVDGIPSITECLGHRDVAPGRKVDPGPNFPMSQFRSILFGRA